MITRDDLESWLAEWDLPLGPFTTIDEVLQAMTASAQSLRPEDAADLAKHALQFARARHPRTRVLSIFLQKYAEQHPEAFAQALLRELAPDGPPLLLDLLGSTAQPWVPTEAAKILDIEHADKDLMIAWAGALGELDGEGARERLQKLQNLPDLDEETKSEIRIAMERLPD